MDETQQILKTRDDNKPIVFLKAENPEDSTKPFVLKEGDSCSWLKKRCIIWNNGITSTHRTVAYGLVPI